LVLFALSLVVLLSALAVILDGGRVYAERRKTQNVADAAAMAGAAVLNKADPAGSLSNVLARACAAAFQNGGFGTGSPDSQCGAGGSVVKIHVPGSGDGPSALPNVNPVFENPGYVQVSVASTFKSFMAGLLGLSDFSAAALGVAVNIPGNSLGDVLLVLDPKDCASFQLNGSNPLNVSGGDVMVDSSAAKSADTFCTNKNAMTQSGGAALNNASGANNIVGSGDATNVSPPWTDADYKPDPLTRVTVPPFDSSFVSPMGTGTANVPVPWTSFGTAIAPAGVYWGGINVGNGDDLVLTGGTYIMAGGGFNVQGGKVSATAGVTLIYTVDKYCNSLVSSAPSGCTNAMKRNGDLDGGQPSVGQPTGAHAGSWGLPAGTGTGPLRAQTLSPDPYSLSDILIYVDRNVIPCPNTILDVGGNGGFYFATGTIVYAPCSTTKLHGNADPPSTGGAVVTWRLEILGNKELNLGGPAVGGQPQSQSNLVQ
jgi:hypothetical protein